jgi:predicted Zn-ribbon and HTH transcriptional regulator
MGTVRQQIIALLIAEEMGLRDLSQELGLSEKDILPHLAHIQKTVQARDQHVVIRPARCFKCGFVFKERRRYSRPGKCPRCRGTHIDNPTFRIRPRQEPTAAGCD